MVLHSRDIAESSKLRVPSKCDDDDSNRRDEGVGDARATKVITTSAGSSGLTQRCTSSAARCLDLTRRGHYCRQQTLRRQAACGQEQGTGRRASVLATYVLCNQYIVNIR